MGGPDFLKADPELYAPVSELGIASIEVVQKILAPKAVADAYILEDHLIPGED